MIEGKFRRVVERVCMVDCQVYHVTISLHLWVNVVNALDLCAFDSLQADIQPAPQAWKSKKGQKQRKGGLLSRGKNLLSKRKQRGGE